MPVIPFREKLAYFIRMVSNTADVDAMSAVTVTATDITATDVTATDVEATNIAATDIEATDITTSAIDTDTLYLNSVEVTASAADINTLTNIAIQGTGTIAPQVGNYIDVTVIIKNASGGQITVPTLVDFYLADDVFGIVPSSVPPDGGIAIKPGGAGQIISNNNNLNGRLRTDSVGRVELRFTHSGARTWYLFTSCTLGCISPYIGPITFT